MAVALQTPPIKARSRAHHALVFILITVASWSFLVGVGALDIVDPIGNSAYITILNIIPETFWWSRSLSLACVLGAVGMVYLAVATKYPRRTALTSAALFGFTSSTLWAGFVQTPDAIGLLLLAYALFMLAQDDWRTRLYAIPLAGLAVILQLGILPLEPEPATLSDLSLNFHLSWVMWLLAPIGVGILIYKRHKTVPLAIALFVLAVAVPVTDVLVGDYTDVVRHVAYSSLLLAPMAGIALAYPWTTPLWTPVVAFLLAITLLWGTMQAYDTGHYTIHDKIKQEETTQ